MSAGGRLRMAIFDILHGYETSQSGDREPGWLERDDVEASKEAERALVDALSEYLWAFAGFSDRALRVPGRCEEHDDV
jgi:hypothetical protein